MKKSDKHPYAEVLVEFFSSENGGRSLPVNLDDKGYRPHLRILTEDEYLGVEFVEGPDTPTSPGQSAHATVRFLFWPDVNYERLVIGTEFEILEGPTVVGKGKVIRR